MYLFFDIRVINMRKYKVNIKKTLENIRCNKCGKEIKIENGIPKEGVFHSEYSWGFFSNKDGDRYSFDLCENCYDEWIGSFRIEPEIEEENELI